MVNKCHTTQLHLPEPYLNLKLAINVVDQTAEGKLTDIVVEPKEGTRKFWEDIRRFPSFWFIDMLPLSPFMMTHILDPTHLSINSSRGSVDESKSIEGVDNLT